MKPDDFGGSQRNVLGGILGSCSEQPPTGFFRDGCCNTSDEDLGSHTICVVLTADFLEFSKLRGNDLSTPRPGVRLARPQARRPLVPLCRPLA